MPKDIVENRIAANDIARISDQDHKRLSRYHLQIGDIVYARRGDIGRCALVTENEDSWLCGTGSLFIRIGARGIVPGYLHYYLGVPSIIGWITSRAVGTTMLNLNTKILKTVPVLYPFTDDQRKIAEMLELSDTKIRIENIRKQAFGEVFKSLLHELMTGQIRVNDLELPQ